MKDLPSTSAKKKIWNKLKEVAMEDGKLSEEEQHLMANIIMDIEKYSLIMEQALQDGMIDTRERRELFEQRMAVVEKAYESARDDAVISDDEMAILKEICKIVLEMEKSLDDKI